MRTFFSASLTATFGLLSSCAAPVYMSESVQTNAVDSAAREIRSSANWVPQYVDDAEAEKKLLKIYANLLPAAESICRQMAEDECGWDIQYSADPNMNAFAKGESVVVIQKGILRHAENDDEIAMVVAHELSHHAANHISETKQNAEVGAIVGALIVGALSGAANSSPYINPSYRQYQINQGVQSGSELGAAIGQLSFSQPQENEADYLAAHILYRSGYDLRKARNMWIKLGRLGKTEHGEQHSVNTHPDPAERLARWDATIKEVEANHGALSRASIQRTSSNTKQDSAVIQP